MTHCILILLLGSCRASPANNLPSSAEGCLPLPSSHSQTCPMASTKTRSHASMLAKRTSDILCLSLSARMLQASDLLAHFGADQAAQALVAKHQARVRSRALPGPLAWVRLQLACLPLVWAANPANQALPLQGGNRGLAGRGKPMTGQTSGCSLTPQTPLPRPSTHSRFGHAHACVNCWDHGTKHLSICHATLPHCLPHIAVVPPPPPPQPPGRAGQRQAKWLL